MVQKEQRIHEERVEGWMKVVDQEATEVSGKQAGGKRRDHSLLMGGLKRDSRVSRYAMALINKAGLNGWHRTGDQARVQQSVLTLATDMRAVASSCPPAKNFPAPSG
jgi:hypothetical protein